jgi:hypothetical protein
MAKFRRFDPRNKKHGKHKFQSQNKDLKIKSIQIKKDYLLSSQTMVEYYYNEGESNVKQLKQGNSH